jgi:hypothetical protein
MEHGVKAAKAFSKLIKQTAPKDGKPGKNRSLVVGTTPGQPVVLVSPKNPTGALAELKAMSKKLGAFTPVAVGQVVFEENEIHVKVLKAANEMAVKKAVTGYFSLYKVSPPSLKVKLFQPDQWEAVEFEEDENESGEGDEDSDDTGETDALTDEPEEEEEDAGTEEETGDTPTEPDPAQHDQIVARIKATVARFTKVAAAVGADPAAAKLLQEARAKLGEANAGLAAGKFDAAETALGETDEKLVQALKTRAPANKPSNPGDALTDWQARRNTAIASLKAVAGKIAAAKHPSSTRAIIEIQGVIKNLTAAPSTLQQVTELQNWLNTDEVVQDVCELAEDVRTPLLGSLERLHAELAA